VSQICQLFSSVTEEQTDRQKRHNACILNIAMVMRGEILR